MDQELEPKAKKPDKKNKTKKKASLTKTKKNILQNEIERYLRIPFYVLIPLVMFNGLIYCANVETGIYLSLIILIYALLVLMLYIRQRPSVRESLYRFAMEQGQVQKALLKDLSVPYVLLDLEGKIIWGNALFYDIVQEGKKRRRSINHIFPEITRELMPKGDKSAQIEISYGEAQYRVELRRVVVRDILPMDDELVQEDGLIAMYLFDETELNHYKQENKDQKIVVGLIYIDNYEEVLEDVEEVRKPLLTALIDRRINKYMQNIDGIVKKLEKDKFLVIFPQKYLEQLQNTKFTLLEEVRSINVGNEISVTLSIGLGAGFASYLQAYEGARISIDFALGRGGDQAVVKTQDTILYYGGKSQGVERNTRVKARVKAYALRELMESKDNVVIMGHRLPDVDCLGSGLGMYRLATTMNKKANIVVNETTTSIRPIVNHIISTNMYPEDLFVDSEQARNLMGPNTLLVVVDVNRPSYTECPELLELTKSVVVFDHHRTMSDSIQGATLSYVEAFASSTCEMIAEILQCLGEKPKLKAIEADAMYSGILVDTDNFVTKTGVRTFDAASFLKRCGADVTRVRKMFRTDLEVYKQKVAGVESAEIFMDHYAIGILPSQGVDSPTVLSAQIANDLLDIDGVKASFMLTQIQDTVYVSARSIDEVNVQIIMERIGGGGHASVAGAQLKECSVEEAMTQLKELLEKMITGGDI